MRSGAAKNCTTTGGRLVLLGSSPGTCSARDAAELTMLTRVPATYMSGLRIAKLSVRAVDPGPSPMPLIRDSAVSRVAGCRRTAPRSAPLSDSPQRWPFRTGPRHAEPRFGHGDVASVGGDLSVAEQEQPVPFQAWLRHRSSGRS